MGLGHLAGFFTKIFAPFGRIFWEVDANDLPAIFLKKDSEKWG
jgi:hypothetical protein